MPWVTLTAYQVDRAKACAQKDPFQTARECAAFLTNNRLKTGNSSVYSKALRSVTAVTCM